MHLDLGQLLSSGEGEVRDLARAVQVLEEGWEQHSDPACAGLLGALYEEELDDDGAALRWLRLAADGGDTSAMVTLGYRHRFGEGVPQDLSEMLRWYRAAAAEEDPTAIANLAICYQNGEGVRQDEARAHGLREQAAGLGHPGSEIWLAFAQLLAFALTHPDGDLDRLPAHPPVRLAGERQYRSLRVGLLA